ncbi:hypothetical protein B0H15DRAFT_961704, partial [Mycena belliarum]
MRAQIVNDKRGYGYGEGGSDGNAAAPGCGSLSTASATTPVHTHTQRLQRRRRPARNDAPTPSQRRTTSQPCLTCARDHLPTVQGTPRRPPPPPPVLPRRKSSRVRSPRSHGNASRAGRPTRSAARSGSPACRRPVRSRRPHTKSLLSRAMRRGSRTTHDRPRKSAARPADPANSGPSGEAPQVGLFAARRVLRRRLARGAGGNRARTPCRHPPRRRAPRRGAISPACLPLPSRGKHAPCCKTRASGSDASGLKIALCAGGLASRRPLLNSLAARRAFAAAVLREIARTR